MNQLLNNNIRKIEYFSFIKKVKQIIFTKKKLKTKIILFQKRFAIEQLLLNVIYEMKNKIIKDKLKQFLVRKFLYTIMAQYIEHYNNEYGNQYNYNFNYNSKEDKIFKINNSKQKLKEYIIKENIYSFLNGANICMNNSRLKLLQYNFINKNRINKLKTYYLKLKEIRNYSFLKHKKILMYKILFIKIKFNITIKKQYVNEINEINKRKNIFILKNIFHKFKNNCKEFKYIINPKTIKHEDNKIKIKTFRNKITAKYFKLFICKIKIIKQTHNSLKRKIFNLIKNNVKISKDLKYYLNEANGIH